MPSAPSVTQWSAWATFLEQIETAAQELGCRPGDDRFYRGHADGSWPLLPTLFRTYRAEAIDHVESDLFFEFQARAKELHHLQLSDWDVLFFMRHHGVPTRLLDWTETLGIALYFALERYAMDRRGAGVTAIEDPCIWILNPYRLNAERPIEEEADLVAPRFLGWNEDEQAYYDYGELLVEEGDWPWGDEPVAIYPQQKPARMSAQRGWFTIHGNSPRPIDAQTPDFVRKVTIAAAAVPSALETLRIGGIDRYGIYADLDGLAASLVAKNAGRGKPTQLDDN